MRTTSSQRMRVLRLKKLEQTDNARARIDRQANAATSWNLPASIVLKEWHIDETGMLSRTVGRNP